MAVTAYDAASTLGPALLPLAERFARDYVKSNGAKLARHLGSKALRGLKNRVKRAKNPLGGGKKGADAVLKPDRNNGRVIYGKKRRRKSKGPVTVKKLAKTVRNLASKVEGDSSSIKYQLYDSGQTSSNTNSVGWTAVDLTNAGLYEAVLNKVPYLNTAAVGTAAAADMTLQAQPASFHFSIYAEWRVRNNWYMPTHCKLYVCTPKVATNVSPTTALGYVTKQAIAGAAAPGYQEMGCFPWDVPDFMDTYKIIETKEFVLNAGDEFTYKMSEPFIYDQEMQDNHANTYLPRINKFVLLRQEGCICHDNTTTGNVGISSSKLDYVKHIIARVKYPSQQVGKFWNVVNSLDVITTSAITGSSADAETQ